MISVIRDTVIFPLTGAIEILDRFRDLQDEERIGRGMPSSLRYCALGIPRPIRSSSSLGHTSRLTAVSWGQTT